MPTRIQAAIFDLDGTLYDYDSAHRVAFAALQNLGRCALGLSEDAFTDLHARADALLRQRCGHQGAVIHNRLIRYQTLCELAGGPLSLAPAMAQTYWGTFLDVIRPFPEAHQALIALRAMGLTIGIGTNMTADYQFKKLSALRLYDAIDFMVTSEEAGAEKPDARLFALCAEKAGCAPGACLFVGDSLQGDAQAARSAGMNGIWLSRNLKTAPGEAPIHNLTELPERVRALSQER